MLFSRKSESHLARMPTSIDAQESMWDRVPAVQPPVGGNIVDSADGAPTQSFIDGSLNIVGDLHSAGDVRIDGRICGNVRCAQLILGPDAAITGSITARQAIVRGRIVGTIRAAVVIIQESAHVESEIIYGSLCIDEGAFFEGSVRRRDNPMEQPAADMPLREVQHARDATEAAPGTTKAPEIVPARPAASESSGKAPMPNGCAPLANGLT